MTKTRDLADLGGGFIQAGTGAVQRTVESKLQDVVSVKDFGVLANNTDQTAAIVSVLSGLGASWEGVIEIPGNIKFNFNQVVPLIPDKAVVHFTNTRQTGSGYRQQFTGVMSNPPDANTDTAFVILDSHYPDLMLNNPRTAGTTSADSGLSGFSWARGFFQNGSGGPRIQWQGNFTKSQVRSSEYNNAGVACFEFRTRAPERAGDYEVWANGINVDIGDCILATNGSFYKAQTAGTSTASPTVTSGTETIGGVTWEYIRGEWVNFRTAFYVDELGRVGTVPVDAGKTQLWQQNPEDAEDFNVWYQASGASKKIQQRFQVTDSGGNRSDTVIFDFTKAAGFRLLDSAGNRILFAADTSRGFRLSQYGLLTYSVPNGDTSPSVNSAGQLRFINTAPTSVVTFDDGLPNQEFSCYFTNSNTTLVHSSALKLRGGVNVTPAADQIITFVREPTSSNYWVEKSRNF
jgi:hypothetical protein